MAVPNFRAFSRLPVARFPMVGPRLPTPCQLVSQCHKAVAWRCLLPNFPYSVFFASPRCIVPLCNFLSLAQSTCFIPRPVFTPHRAASNPLAPAHWIFIHPETASCSLHGSLLSRPLILFLPTCLRIPRGCCAALATAPPWPRHRIPSRNLCLYPSPPPPIHLAINFPIARGCCLALAAALSRPRCCDIFVNPRSRSPRPVPGPASAPVFPSCLVLVPHAVAIPHLAASYPLALALLTLFLLGTFLGAAPFFSPFYPWITALGFFHVQWRPIFLVPRLHPLGRQQPCGAGPKDCFVPLAQPAPIPTPASCSVLFVFLLIFLGVLPLCAPPGQSPPPHFPSVCLCRVPWFPLFFCTLLPACTHNTAALVVTPSQVGGNRDQTAPPKHARRSKGPGQDTRRGTDHVERPYQRPVPGPGEVRTPHHPGGGERTPRERERTHTKGTRGDYQKGNRTERAERTDRVEWRTSERG